MPKTLHYLSLLLNILLIGCQDDRKNAFEPWQLFNANTSHVLVFNNTVTGLQNLNRQTNQNTSLSLPTIPRIIDSIGSLSGHEGFSYLFIDELRPNEPSQRDKFTFTWAIKVNDTITKEETEAIVNGQDTLFVFSQNNYRIYSNKKSLALNTHNPYPKALNNLIKMIQLKKDKALVIGQKLDHSLGKIILTQEAWTVYDTQSSTLGTAAHGVLLKPDIDSLVGYNQRPLAYDLGQKASILHSAEITPLNAQSSLSIALNNPQSLSAKIKAVDSMFVMSPFIETIEEASLIEFSEGKAVALKSLDMNSSLSTFSYNWTQEENYRGVSLKTFDGTGTALSPLPQIFEEVPKMTLAFVWEDYIIFTPSQDLAKEYINQLQNKNTLARSNAWHNSQEDLARESSVLSWTKANQSGQIETLQLIEDKGFAHLNYALQTGEQKTINENSGPLLRSIQLNAPISGVLQFFSNHKSGGKNIVVQDENHRLYFIAPSGKTLWYRDLKEPILGPIQEVDLLRNGKKQLAFVTQSKWYIIDRNGRNVNSFPKSFSDPITQPLAIFDYDNNRKYRFVIVQDQSVYMFDAQGKRVKGFTYNKAPAIVSHPPTHIRINGKDYLLFLLKNGQLQILNRTGKVRIPVSEQFDFGPNVPIKHEGKFVFWTQDGSQIQISPEGTVIKLTAKSPAEYRVVYYGAHTIEFDDPLLRIDQHLIELPLGNYLGPQVFKFGNKLRTVMLDQDSQKLFIYNSEGRLLKDLPFFGTSTIDLADINNNGQLELVVRGQENEVLLYSLN